MGSQRKTPVKSDKVQISEKDVEGWQDEPEGMFSEEGFSETEEEQSSDQELFDWEDLKPLKKDSGKNGREEEVEGFESTSEGDDDDDNNEVHEENLLRKNSVESGGGLEKRQSKKTFTNNKATLEIKFDPRFHLSADFDDHETKSIEKSKTNSGNANNCSLKIKASQSKNDLKGSSDLIETLSTTTRLTDSTLDTSIAKTKKIIKPLTAAKLADFQEKQNKTGIVYLSRIPPFMKPLKIRHLLGKFGEIGRVYLAPEDAKVQMRRKKYGGNKKKNYTEGWVEFMDKRVAKKVAGLLNATLMGGNKRNYYHDDLWNIKYLPKFKWNHLTEQIAYETAARSQRLQAEISQAKRETKDYIRKVEKAKMIENMEKKKHLKRQRLSDQTNDHDTSHDNELSMVEQGQKLRRQFKQRKLVNSEAVLSSHASTKRSITTAINTNEPKELDSKMYTARYMDLKESRYESSFPPTNLFYPQPLYNNQAFHGRGGGS
ncbi:hypothetical protein G9A89_002684 [Geosiphon pyriformis]|nr:hypothetical protein G9A89_002684 [Geosiphon pyriformis]